jgi:DNA ligase (NAD+)
MTTIVDDAGYAQAIETAGQAAAAYYAAGDSSLDDDAFDTLMRAIAAYEAAHPESVLPGSPTGKVAAGAAVGDVPHTVPMLSLDNVFSADGLTDWAAGLERRLGRPVRQWCVEPKLDGLAIAARYRDGRLVQLITRGNGTEGEDVSHAAGTITGLPAALTTAATVEVRGEVLMTAEQFGVANTLRAEHGGIPFANPRSAAAGSLRAKDRAYTVQMTFFGYGALPLDDTAELTPDLAGRDHSAIMRVVEELGVATTSATPVGLLVCETIAEAQQRVEQIAELRADLPFGIDGIVIKADTAADQEEAGFSTRAPRWAIAYKLPAVEKFTKLVDVEWQVGRTGIVAPRGVLEPVILDGAAVTYATLHNPAIITKLGLMLGDQVAVKKAGDVIPRIEGPLVQARTGDERPIPLPAVCPHCGGELDTSQERWRCLKGRACRAAASIIYAVGRNQLDIEGLGETRVQHLVDTGLVADVGDLFTLTREQLLAQERMAETSTDQLLAALEAAKRQPLSRVLAALGVRGTGRSMSRRIARHFATMDAIRAADSDALQEVEGVGPEKVAVLLEELRELSPVIEKLVAAGVNMTEPGVTPAAQRSPEPAADLPSADLPLAGQTVVVTGSMTGRLEGLSRNAMNELIERAGGRAAGSVSSRTSTVVAGEGAGSKLKKAEELGVTVISPVAFAALVEHLLPDETNS